MLPRVDVGYSGFVAAIVALAMLGFNHLAGFPVETAIVGPSAVVIVAFLLGYFFPTAKEAWETLGAAAVVLVQAYFSARRGEPVDTALVTTALTAVANVVLVWVLPRVQPPSG